MDEGMLDGEKCMALFCNLISTEPDIARVCMNTCVVCCSFLSPLLLSFLLLVCYIVTGQYVQFFGLFSGTFVY